MERNRPLSQQYDLYTSEDFAVWRALFERQMHLLNQYGSRYYKAALYTVGFEAASIPDFNVVNQKLKAATGWQITVVPGLVPAAAFFALLARRIFPATCWLRTMAELDYIEEPDMFHDVFGHIPLLSHPAYADFMHAFGQLGLRWNDDERKMELMSRIYWYTIEFGLIREDGQPKIYGAGILSSPGETLRSMAPDTKRSAFQVPDILDTPFRTDVLQEAYFEISDLDQLTGILEEVAVAMRQDAKHSVFL
ncbi:Phenylalanine-4-hydroxylase [compost metagenome]